MTAREDESPFECVLDVGAGVGEGPVWSVRDQVLWWVEIIEGRLHRFDPFTGQDQSWQFPSMLGCVLLQADGQLVLGLQDGFQNFDPISQRAYPLGGMAPGDTADRFNDGVVAPDGARLLATTMAAVGPFDDPRQSLICLDPDGTSRTILNGLRIGNGLAFSPDGRTLYVSETHESEPAIWAFDWDMDDGVAENRRLFFDPRAHGLTGRPDGAVIDVDGCYWYAGAHGWEVVQVSPKGALLRRISVPVQKPTKMAFGGAALDTLYLTSIGTNLAPGTEDAQPLAGGVFAYRPGVSGIAASTYRRPAGASR